MISEERAGLYPEAPPLEELSDDLNYDESRRTVEIDVIKSRTPN